MSLNPTGIEWKDKKRLEGTGGGVGIAFLAPPGGSG